MAFLWPVLGLSLLVHLVAGGLTNESLTFPPSMTINTTVDAGHSMQVAAIPGVDIYNGDTSLVASYRVYLAVGPSESRQGLGVDFFHSQCYLNYSISTCDPTITVSSAGYGHVLFNGTTFNVTIPQDIGPPNIAAYSIRVQLFQTDKQSYGSDFSSNAFSLSGATGNFSTFQLNDLTLWTSDGIPCTSFACVKNCADQAGLVDWSSGNSSNGTVGINYRDCVKMCPGDIDLDYGQANSTSNTGAPVTSPSACSISSSIASDTGGIGGLFTTTPTPSVVLPTPNKNTGHMLDSSLTWVALGSTITLAMNALKNLCE